MSVTAGILLTGGEKQVDGTPIALAAGYAEGTLVEWQIAQLMDAHVDVIEVVVSAATADLIIPLVARDNVEPIVDPASTPTEGSATRVGATAVPRDARAAIIVDLSKPAHADACRLLIASHRQHAAAVTRHRDTPTPAVVSPAVLGELRNLPDSAQLETVFARHEQETTIVRTA